MRLLPRIRYVAVSIGGEANARHTFFGGVRIWTGAPHRMAVLAQEVYEWRFLRLAELAVILAIAVLVIAFGLTSPLELAFAGFIAIIARVLTRFIPGLIREMELRGHMIEVLVAERLYGADREAKLRNEAKIMVKYYDQFKSDTWQEVVAAMMARESKVRRFADGFGR